MEEIIVSIILIYGITGVCMAVMVYYMSEDMISFDEMIVSIFFWPLMVQIAIKNADGIQGLIRDGFLNDKKGFFIRYFILVLCVIILVSFLYIIGRWI